MRLFIVLLFTLFSITTTSAQNIMVLSKSNNQSIPSVAIYNETKSKTTVTDFDGMADISAFTDTETLYFKHISHLGASSTKSEILASGNKMYMEVDDNQLSEVVISVSKWEQDKRDVTQKIVSIKAEEIAFGTPQTSADLLQNSGQVFIQKSQLGGGSPIIRGFSTNRLLLTVDGVRMNNAIFRGGNVQNVISIDPFTVDRTEVILGPGSVVYGSDAVGGVINFYTPQPKFAISGKNKFSGNAIVRYASASNERTGHIDFNIGLEKWAFLTSISYTDFDDLKIGSNGPDDYLRTEFVQTIDGVDTVVQNDDPETQVSTGYEQINFLQKVLFSPNEKLDIHAGFVYTETSDYPRYDRLIRRDDDGQFSSAEWFYGPQKWLFGNIQLTYKRKNAFYDKLKFTAAYQNYQESRNDRDFGDETLVRTQEDLDIYSANLDFEKKFSEKTAVYYGLEYVLNHVFSDGSNLNVFTDEVTDAPSRYPDGSTWQSIAAYASIKSKLSEKLRFQGGLRYNRIILFSQFDDTFFDFPFTEANIDTDAVTGTAGFSWLPNDILQWKLNFSTAFRAPNIDDVGKIFDSEPGSVVVPNPDLEPEYAYNGELGVSATFNKFTIDLATYYTQLDNALVRRDFSLNGETEVLFSGELSNVQAIQNAANAQVYGFEAGISYDFAKNFNLTSKYTFTGGEEELDDGSISPSRHVAPQFGSTNVTYSRDKWMIDISALYNGKFDFEDLAESQRNNAFLYALDEDGNPFAPSWYVLTLRSQYQFTKSLQATATIENITDQRYRTYSSGISGAGRNFILSLKYSL